MSRLLERYPTLVKTKKKETPFSSSSASDEDAMKNKKKKGEDDDENGISLSSFHHRTESLRRDVERLTGVLARRTASHEFEASDFASRLSAEEGKMMINRGEEGEEEDGELGGRGSRSREEKKKKRGWIIRSVMRAVRRILAGHGLPLLFLFVYLLLSFLLRYYYRHGGGRRLLLRNNKNSRAIK